MMDPARLPARTGLQRATSIALRILFSAPFRLLWTLLLLFGVLGAVGLLSPTLGRLPATSVAGAARNALAATLALWLTLRLFEGKHLSDAVGLSAGAAPSGLARGFLLGALVLSGAVAFMGLLGDYRVAGFGAGATARNMGYAALLFFLVAVFEEVLARGILFRLLEQALGTWAALALSALLFGMGHLYNPGATALSSFAIALEAGVLLGAAYLVSRSLWLPIGVHTAWNFFEGPVFGTPVSGISVPALLDAHVEGPTWLTGGAFGPEAGLPAVVCGTAVGGLLLVLAWRRGQFQSPAWLARLRLWLHGRNRPRPGSQPLEAQ